MSLLKFLCFLICVVAVCAKPHIQTRVIGGQNVVNPSLYRYVISLRQKVRYTSIFGIPIYSGTYPDPKPHFCTGAIIAPKWILTANHCLDDCFVHSILNSILNGLPLDLKFLKNTVCGLQDSDAFVVQVNTLNLDSIDSANEYAVAASIQHPDYNSNTIENDIGLVKLVQSILNAVPIAMAIELPADYTAAKILGWGLTNGNSSTLPNTLQVGDLSILPLSACVAAMANTGGSITPGNVCGVGGGDTGACSGDSGGPLVVSESGSPTTVGVTSWVINDCDTNYPSAFASVAHYYEYIIEKTGIV